MLCGLNFGARPGLQGHCTGARGSAFTSETSLPPPTGSRRVVESFEVKSHLFVRLLYSTRHDVDPLCLAADGLGV